MSREPSRRDWHVPPCRHTGLAPLETQRPDSPAGAAAVACFILLIFFLAIVVPEIR